MLCQFRGQRPLSNELRAFARLLESIAASGPRLWMDGERFLQILETVDPHGYDWLRELGIENLTHDALVNPQHLPDIEMALDTPDWGAASVRQGLQCFGDAVPRTARAAILDRAEYDSHGTVSVSYHAPGISQSVRRGDIITAGAAFTGCTATGAWSIEPRVYRVRCRNGAMSELGVSHAPNVQALELSEVSEVTEGEVQAFVHFALSGRDAAAKLRRVAESATMPAADPVEGLAEVGVRVPETQVERVRANFESEGDRTVYGAFNALTRAARDAETTTERVGIERCAGALLLAPVLEPKGHTPPKSRTRMRA